MDHSQHEIHNADDYYPVTPDNIHSNHAHMHGTVTPANPKSIGLDVDHSQHDHSLHSHSMSSGSTMEHMMSMAFHFGYNETILFTPWQISTVSGLIGSMFAIFIMATLYEGLKYYREYLFWKTYNLLEYRPVSMPEKSTISSNEENRPAPAVHYVGEVIHKQPPSIFSWMHLYQTFLHIIQVTLSFLLMLIFMTYNVWLCMAVVFGAAVGYFLFCWKKSVIVDVTEHCH